MNNNIKRVETLFQIGDIVRCVNNDNDPDLIIGKEYKVTNVAYLHDPLFCGIISLEGSEFDGRYDVFFELVKRGG